MVMDVVITTQKDICVWVGLEINFALAPNPLGAELPDLAWVFLLIRFDPTRPFLRASVNMSPGEMAHATLCIGKAQIDCV
jgi:hypothetical protein